MSIEADTEDDSGRTAAQTKRFTGITRALVQVRDSCVVTYPLHRPILHLHYQLSGIALGYLGSGQLYQDLVGQDVE